MHIYNKEISNAIEKYIYFMHIFLYSIKGQENLVANIYE